VIGRASPEAERVQLDLLRAASPERRGELALSLSRTVLALAREHLEREDPAAPPGEIDLRFLRRLYGRPLADAGFGGWGIDAYLSAQ
jgi:hypothetical protein